MKLSLHSEYALLALIHLARINQPATPKEVATVQQIPAETLAEILLVLIRSGYAAQNPANSQIQLAKSADTVSVGEIIRLFDGALAPLEPVSARGYAPAPMDNEQKLSGLFEKIQEEISQRLETAMISEMT